MLLIDLLLIAETNPQLFCILTRLTYYVKCIDILGYNYNAMLHGVHHAWPRGLCAVSGVVK